MCIFLVTYLLYDVAITMRALHNFNLLTPYPHFLFLVLYLPIYHEAATFYPYTPNRK